LKKFTTDSKYSIIILLNHYLDLINLTKLSFKSRYIILIYKNIYYIIYIIWLWKNHHLTIANHHLNVQNFWFSQLRLHEPRTYPYRGNRDNCFFQHICCCPRLSLDGPSGEGCDSFSKKDVVACSLFVRYCKKKLIIFIYKLINKRLFHHHHRHKNYPIYN